ncbi:hypothetical protein [Acinetobacter pittii]|uniref:hypothetical protein n=1 Tax=Acinetobacter pittii TaxID=48296 RepID=UPI00158118BD|nr:hypothetical protein [Acinetobacter pittii]NUF43105.1 hypothetical protein [Acinetobacter pittii]
MKASISSLAKQVLDGRRKVIRQMVLTTTSSIPALVYGKKVLETAEGHRLDNSWGGLGVMGEDDEQAVDYEAKGCAMVLLDNFTGAALNKRSAAVDSAAPSFSAYVEPFNSELDLFKQLLNPVDWTFKSGDIMCLLLNEDSVLWVENVGSQGQTMVGDFGVKYLLNKRDDLAYLKLFDHLPDVP